MSIRFRFSQQIKIRIDVRKKSLRLAIGNNYLLFHYSYRIKALTYSVSSNFWVNQKNFCINIDLCVWKFASLTNEFTYNSILKMIWIFYLTNSTLRQILIESFEEIHIWSSIYSKSYCRHSLWKLWSLDLLNKL
jgi:hypothetical protein